jgi:metal-dependent amidase/aminoacylase/carboxypeptidase family protein
MVTTLTTIHSRSLGSTEKAVFTICHFKSGTAVNVIPESAMFEGTIRDYYPETSEKIVRRANEIVNGIAQAMGCTVDI